MAGITVVSPMKTQSRKTIDPRRLADPLLN